MNRWYASQAAAERGWGLLAPEGERTARTVGARLLLGVCHPEVLVNHATLRVVDVTGRSLAHIDRLARDWIAHGVAPTKDGERGVTDNPANTCPKHEPFWRLDPPCETCRPADTYRRAEARARRVVRR